MGDQDYSYFIEAVLSEIADARHRAHKSLNRHQVALNFTIGKLIVENQELHGWGKSVVEALSSDIGRRLGASAGFSPQNLWRMRKFYIEYRDEPGLLALAEKIPWGQNLLVIQHAKGNQEREYYLRATDELAWSRSVLLNQIKGEAFRRRLAAPNQNNFRRALPAHLSEQAEEALKSEYNLDFLGITGPVLERELENRLIGNVRDLIMELGYGFCFVGNQYRLSLGEKEYFIDLLFYHRFLKCMVALELKTVEFAPEFAGKMNFYLELLDEGVKAPDDNPSIGIILCPEKDSLEVEYALRINGKPIGVSEYRLTSQLPDGLRGQLPDSEELRVVLERAKNT